jgi:3-hydroxyisobutyrate dehydrogenase-like beta-hydroxyacid dehydrogenase
MNNVGFIGVGYMGYGIAKNILEKGNNLFVIANKNRKPIDKIVDLGATEVNTLEEFKEKKLNVLVKCVTNTPIAKEIATKLSNILDENTLIIDITTHNKTGSIETEKIYHQVI